MSRVHYAPSASPKVGDYEKKWNRSKHFRCYFAMGKIRGTPYMRSHILLHRATTKYFSNSFVLKPEIEKEGLPRGGTPALGAGGLEFRGLTPHRAGSQKHTGSTTQGVGSSKDLRPPQSAAQGLFAGETLARRPPRRNAIGRRIGTAR